MKIESLYGGVSGLSIEFYILWHSNYYFYFVYCKLYA